MSLLQAYNNTHYTTASGITLLIGKSNVELDTFMHTKGFQEAIYMTAWNPFSQALTATENASRNQQLLYELEKRALSFHIEKGVGQDPTGDWPGEESFLVLGMDKDLGYKLALKYEQNAFVYYPRNGVAELVITSIFQRGEGPSE